MKTKKLICFFRIKIHPEFICRLVQHKRWKDIWDYMSLIEFLLTNRQKMFPFVKVLIVIPLLNMLFKTDQHCRQSKQVIEIFWLYNSPEMTIPLSIKLYMLTAYMMSSKHLGSTVALNTYNILWFWLTWLFFFIILCEKT